ncbi:MAG: sulfur oxidation c-type cytochrome SoxA [Alphaproteobacteria bacterium]|jgi:sulfur-oxidizing protein SoxA|nr:sulfur oxidation c-type cytochrome SoxA [Alphaproteobacteria bacterium]
MGIKRDLSLFVWLTAFVAIGACGSAANAEDWGKYQIGELRSGYTYASKETRAMQDDDFDNPSSLWMDQGEELWSKVKGKAGKSCASCHGDAADSMKGVAARYPVYDKTLGKLKAVQQQINICREERMQAKPLKWESNKMLAMTVYVKSQSRDMPVNVKIDGPAAPFFEKGKAHYFQRRGQLNLACKHCHEDNAGNLARANLLSQGHSNGFPLYRLAWQRLGSLHRRFRGCDKNVRARPFGYGSDEYVNLELFLASRGRGLPVETPAVRN